MSKHTSIQIPIFLEEIRYNYNPQIAQFTYYSITSSGTLLKTINNIPMIHLNEYGILYKPLGRARVFHHQRIKELLNLIEKDPMLNIEIGTLNIPLSCINENLEKFNNYDTKVFRVSFSDFSNMFHYSKDGFTSYNIEHFKKNPFILKFSKTESLGFSRSWEKLMEETKKLVNNDPKKIKRVYQQ